MDCGPTCLRMVAKHYGKNFTLQRLREISGINREGVSLLGISEAAEKIGFRTMGSRLKIEQLADLELPAILLWNQNHFVVLYRIKNGVYFVADPSKGLIQFTLAELKQRWLSTKDFGIALVLSPTPESYAETKQTLRAYPRRPRPQSQFTKRQRPQAQSQLEGSRQIKLRPLAAHRPSVAVFFSVARYKLVRTIKFRSEGWDCVWV